MAILRNNKGNMFRVETCKYCTDYRGQPKPILPEDMWGKEVRAERQLKEHKELQPKMFEDKIRKMSGTGKWY